jgi:hypothetical protein
MRLPMMSLGGSRIRIGGFEVSGDDRRGRRRLRTRSDAATIRNKGTGMSSNLSRKSRRRWCGCVQIELLEVRGLLSGAVSGSDVQNLGVTATLDVQAPADVNQEQGAFTVTMTLQTLVKQGPTVAFQNAALDYPLTVDLGASLASAGSPGIFEPVNESVTFPPGVSTETVSVPINSTVATAGPVTIDLSAKTSSSSVLPIGPPQSLALYGTPDAIPPTIMGVQPITKGSRTSAIAITFSKPMAPSTVENIHNYVVTSWPKTQYQWDVFSRVGLSDPTANMNVGTFPIKAASYDPGTSTVTLTLTRPTRSSSLYAVKSPRTLAGHELTDSEGHPLAEPDGARGTFSVALETLAGSPAGTVDYAHFEP